MRRGRSSLDEATADVLHQLVAGGGGDPLLVMLAYRAEWIRTSLPRGITELTRNDRTLSLELGPLDDSEIAELVALAAPVRPAPEDVARIARAAQGSPFFALELARALASGAADALPQTVRQAIIDRLVGLDSTTTDALTMLAVAEAELDLASVLALTGLDERDAFALLDAALDTGFSSWPERARPRGRPGSRLGSRQPHRSPGRQRRRDLDEDDGGGHRARTRQRN